MHKPYGLKEETLAALDEPLFWQSSNRGVMGSGSGISYATSGT